MQVSLPVYVIQQKRLEGRVYVARPLFGPEVEASDSRLQRALTRLSGKLSHALQRLADDDSHDALATACFDADLTAHRVAFRLALRRRERPIRMLFVSAPCELGRLAFAPGCPGLWLDVEAGESLEARAAEAATAFFRRWEKEGVAVERQLRRLDVEGKAMLLHADVELRLRRAAPRGPASLAALFADAPVRGEDELRRVGRCLDEAMQPEDAATVQREQEVTDLTRLLQLQERRPVVLVGQHLAGKTAVVREVVRRRLLDGPHRPGRPAVWLLDPGRLVSGMSYVGQWEKRLLAILQFAKKRDHVLYFTDFLGLFQAGVASCSALSMADVLRQWIRRRDVRVLCEMTPEAWNRLRRRDQALADQFHVLPVRPTTEEQTWKVLLHAAREIEGASGRQFQPAVLPELIQLTRRYEPASAFPGKAARWLGRLAKRAGREPVSADDAVRLYSDSTGLNRDVLDRRAACPRQTVEAALARKMIGQPAAVAALTDVVMMAKARLNAPERPLAAMLFVGPTGVGKTHCAKTLAEYLFGDERRLLRFDMNEFNSPTAAADLAGSPRRPEGLLTAAIRRQPFQVLLLDEIEKAHPDVFDLLLQVLGEGRLTDAHGRVSDFTQAIIILTSNLGAAESGRAVGFERSTADQQRVYTRAAEQFFRPEFYNRLDRVLAFQPLTRYETRRIADLLLDQVLQRDGFLRRRCLVRIDREAMDRVVDAGYHPDLGARALKRAIERELVAPLANRLSGEHEQAPVVISIHASSTELVSAISVLQSVEPRPGVDLQAFSTAEAAAAGRAALTRFEAEVAERRVDSPIVAGRLTEEQAIYFELKEHLNQFHQLLQELDAKLADARERRQPPTFPSPPLRKVVTTLYGARHLPREVAAAQDIHQYLHDVLQSASPLDGARQAVLRIRRQAALLHNVLRQPSAAGCVMLQRPLSRAPEAFAASVRPAYDLSSLDVQHEELGEQAGFRVSRRQGVAAWPLLRGENGVWLTYGPNDEVAATQVLVFPLAPGQDARDTAAEVVRREADWLAAFRDDRRLAEHNPLRADRLLRVVSTLSGGVDARTATALPPSLQAADYADLLLAALPDAPEFGGGRQDDRQAAGERHG